ncbi:MAG: pentapeptide repeat-containing protein [Nanoarchaeota archaeon]
MALTKLKGKEFVKKVLSGETDFSNIILEESFDLNSHESFDDLTKYLKEQKLKDSCLNLSGSSFRYLKAKNLYLPSVIAKHTNFYGSTFSGANLNKADLERADLREANLYEANLRYADLRYANLRSADLGYANLIRANLEKANLVRANLHGANLERVNLYGAKF